MQHLTAPQIEGYRSRQLPPADLLAADRHLAGCEACREQLNPSGRAQPAMLALLKNLQAAAKEKPQHLSYEQLAAYVKGELDALDRELVEGHAELCRRCAQELADLRDFAAMMTAAPVVEGKPAPSLWRRLFAPTGWGAMRLAGAAATLLLFLAAATVVYYSWRVESQEPGEMVTTPPAPPGLPEGVPDTSPTTPPQPEPSKPLVAYLVLIPGARGEKRTALRLPRQAEQVSIQISVAGDEYASYRATLQPERGGRPVNLRGLKPRQTRLGKAIFLLLPASRLPDGNYSLRLMGGAGRGEEFAGQYQIRVERF